MHKQRYLLSILYIFALISFFLPWFHHWRSAISGLHLGAFALFALVSYLLLVLVVLIDDTSNTLSKRRLLALLASNLAVLLTISYACRASVLSRSWQELPSFLGYGFYGYYLSNVLAIFYMIYFYQIHTVDALLTDDLLDEKIK